MGCRKSSITICLIPVRQGLSKAGVRLEPQTLVTFPSPSSCAGIMGMRGHAHLEVLGSKLACTSVLPTGQSPQRLLI